MKPAALELLSQVDGCEQLDCLDCRIKESLDSLGGHLRYIEECDPTDNLRLNLPCAEHAWLDEGEVDDSWPGLFTVRMQVGLDRFDRMQPVNDLAFPVLVYQRLRQLANELATTADNIRKRWPDWFDKSGEPKHINGRRVVAERKRGAK